ncbi:MAG: caspase family protein [Pseudomonadota bacterium]
MRILFGVVLLALAAALPAQAETRKALLIGLQHYADEVGPLDNPHKDVDLMADALAQIGFDVQTIKDATDTPVSRSQILAGIRSHAEAVANDPDAISFVYYSGHGAANEEDNRNYLVPTSVTDAGSAEIWDSSVQLDTVLERLTNNAPTAAHFVIFDACRNELKLRRGTRSLNKGFVVKPDPGGVFLAFSTSPGLPASDGEVDDPAGPYATVLADEIRKGGRRHTAIFEDVKIRVTREYEQTPWENNGLSRIVFLNGQDGAVTELPPLERPAEEEGSVIEASSMVDEDTGPTSIRKALIITNYDEALPETVAANAAVQEDLVTSMRGTGFTATAVTNPSRESLIAEFANLYRGFDGDAFEKLALVYYIGDAGAVAEDGPNYLIPANRPITSTFDLHVQGVELSALLDRTGRPGDVDTVMVVEGCKNLDLPGASAEGCVEEAARDNVLLTFTAPAEVEAPPRGNSSTGGATVGVSAPAAEDSYNVVFSREILKGGSITEAVKRTNDEQITARGGEQIAVSGELERVYELPSRNRTDLYEQKVAQEVATDAYLTERPTLSLPGGAYGSQSSDPTTCFNAVQNRVAWSANGASKTWAEQNVANLCAGAETSTLPARCFQSFMNEGRKSGGLWRADWRIAIALCNGVSDTARMDARFACLQRADTKTEAMAKTCAAR